MTRLHFGYALLAGAAVGTVQGFGFALWTSHGWFTGFLLCLVPAVLQAVILLFALAVAAEVQMRHLPPWVPFVVAGLLGSLVSGGIDLALVGRTLDPASYTSSSTLTTIWFNLPSTLLVGLLASLAYMHLLQEIRCTTALQAMRLGRTRAARAVNETLLLALRARVDPPFLIATLRDVDQLYDQSPARAERLLDQLIVFLRAALPRLYAGSSTVAKELALLDAWFEVVHLRAGGEVSIQTDIDPRARASKLPAMILLPLVSSSFLNVGAQLAWRIAVSTVAERLRLVVTVDGPQEAHLSMQRAQQTAWDRLRTLYGSAATTVYDSVNAYRSETVVELPLEQADRDHC